MHEWYWLVGVAPIMMVLALVWSVLHDERAKRHSAKLAKLRSLITGKLDYP
jgi:Flp pilus assembly protein TadB